MFTVTLNRRTHSYQSSCPELKCLRATDTSSLAHQITDFSSHSFYAASSRRQIELRIFPIRSKLISPPQKFPDRHAHNAGSHWSLNKILQPLENRFQPWTVRYFQRLTGKPVKALSHGSAYQFAFASSSASLQLTDEMELTQLHNPAMLRSQPNDPSDVVGDRGVDAFVDPSGDRCEYLRPTLHILPAREKHRIEENRSILTARLHRHQIQDPMISAKPKIQSVEDQDQRPGQVQTSGASHILTHRLMEAVAQSSLGKTTVTLRKTFQSPALQKNCVQKPGRKTPPMTTPLLQANPPCAFALTALTTAGTKTVYCRPTARRFRVQGFHARELCVYSQLKWVRYR